VIGNDLRALTVATALGSGCAAGVYLAFSTLVMPGLGKLPAPQAITAMNAFNRAAPRNPLLMLVLFGSGVGCVLLLSAALRHRNEPGAGWLITGAGLYLVSVLVMLGYHIPHNDRLLKLDPTTDGAGDVWSRWRYAWMMWNHIRTLGAAGGTVSLLLAVRSG
jgi:uncharacterized membrane protein